SAPYVLTFGGTLAGTNVGDVVTTTVTALQAIGEASINTTTAGNETNLIDTAEIDEIRADFGTGGANGHGSDAIVLRESLDRMISLLNEGKRKHNEVLVALDEDS